MEPDLTPILEDLAAGRITAAEADRRIEHARNPAGEPDAEAPPSSAPEPEEPSWGDIARDLLGAASGLAHSAGLGVQQVGERLQDSASSSAGDSQRTRGPVAAAVTPEQPAGNQGVERVSLRATGRRVRIIGDPSIATVTVDGPHVLRRSGSTMEVTCDGELGASRDGFSVLSGPLLTHGLGGLRHLGLEELRAIGLGKQVLLRVNPAIPVDAEVTAGSLTTDQVRWLGRIRVTAGGATLRGVHQVADALVQAGGATVAGVLAGGRSRVRVESGNLVVELPREADVTVRAEAQVGRIAWPGGAAALHEYQAGQGSGRLDVTVVMGGATVRHEGVEEPPQDAQQQQQPQQDGPDETSGPAKDQEQP
ncbi:hypothetical protein [Luteococcus sp. OSA5]|uniref:hypothetical protein n=1 Tax=Luteococcus sp. OSA5 TaxID=3401630 RepID=UPI003B43CE76